MVKAQDTDGIYKRCVTLAYGPSPGVVVGLPQECRNRINNEEAALTFLYHRFMQYALVNEKREKAFKDGRGICPKCQGTVTASCGDIYIWHWKHKNLRDCDSWSEPETEWHLGWKEQFPEDWQEVVIEDVAKEIKHIADIKTAKGLVIEFQNSSISNSEIRDREDFYNNMIWVVNAEKFKSNFSLSSVVKRKLRNLEQTTRNQKEVIEKQNEEELNIVRENLKSLKLNYPSIEAKSKRLEDDWFEYVEYLSQSQCFSDVIIAQLKESKSISNMELLTEPYTVAKMVVKKLEKIIMSQETTINYLTSEKSLHHISNQIRSLLQEIQKDLGEKFVIVNQSIQ